MRTKAFIPLLIGLGLGGLAIKMGFGMLRRAQASQGTTMGAVVAASAIEPATGLTASCLSVQRVPPALVPAAAFTSVKKLAGRVSRTLIPKGMVITEAVLAPPGTKAGLSSRIPDGFRAVSVKVDEASGVAGFLVAGARVDVSAVMTEQGSRPGEKRVRGLIVLQNVEVGAVGQSLTSGESDGKTGKMFRSVTLLLKPEDVPKLQLYMSRGQIHLAMRNGREGSGDGIQEAAGRMKDFLSGLLPRRPVEKVERVEASPAVPQAPAMVVEVYRGSQVERLVFNSSNGEAASGSDSAARKGRTRSKTARPRARPEAKAPTNDKEVVE